MHRRIATYMEQDRTNASNTYIIAPHALVITYNPSMHMFRDLCTVGKQHAPSILSGNRL